jgi:hypothetical protein
MVKYREKLPTQNQNWVYCKSITNFQKLWNSKSKEKVGLNLIGQYDVQTNFFSRKINEIYMYK